MRKKNEFLLLLTALIWGIAFVAQSAGGDAVGPFTFNCVRSFIGSGAVAVAIIFLDKLKISHKPKTNEERKNLLIGGGICGLLLCTATNLQQLAISSGAQAGKAGFLTACYVILVPILGIFIKKKCGWNVWISVLLAMIGLYLLCIKDEFKLEKQDILLLACAFVFSLQILVVDHFSPKVCGVRMSCIQFLVVGIVTSIPMIVKEMHPFTGGIENWCLQFADVTAWIPILYAGICSCGIAYTLQILGQEGVNPTIASLLMSLESVFSVIAGWLLLHEMLSVKALMGCAFIFAAIVLAQLPMQKIMQKANAKDKAKR